MKNFKKIKKKQLALSTLVALACVGHIGYATDSATTSTTENGVTNNFYDITINNIKEDSGLELGNNARARGNGSIATGTGSLAVGNNAVATGGNETKDTITGKLNENKQRLTEISNAQNTITNLVNEIQKLRSEGAKAIEAGERVKQVRLAKEKAHQDYLNKQNAWSTEVANSAEFLREAQSKLDDLNNRLGAVNRLGGVDITSEGGLTAAATNLKRMTEEGSTLNLPLDSFYKEYIKAHYKAMGDLRNNQLRNTNSQYFEFTNVYNMNLPETINKYYLSAGIEDSFEYDRWGNYLNINIFNGGNKKYNYIHFNAFDGDKNLTNRPTKDILNKNINTDLTTEDEWNSIKEEAPKYKQSIREYFNKNNNPLFTPELKNQFYEEMDKKIDYFIKGYEITYYQKKYEDTHNTMWLDKKNIAIKEYNSIATSYNLQHILLELKNKYKEWEKENVTDILEKNKITTNKLTSDLETALQINKNAVAEKEKQIVALKSSADQAKTNWESINPNASDLLYMEQYETLMKQLTAKSQELQQNQERLTALKNALTLHNLSNVGENAMAIGTNALSTGSNSIAIGTGTIVTGENSISIGKGSAVTGTKSIAVGVGHIVIGNNSGTFGDPNTIYSDGSYAFGNNNTIGDATTTHTVGTNTFVLGSNVKTKANNSVVLGKDSVATEDNVVSIGSNTSTRKLVNVTDGTIAENSKEAINGNQLWKVSEAKDGAINKTAWQAALGTGTAKAGDKGLITGETLHAALANVQIDPSTLTSKANTNASNITSEDAKKWSEKLGTGTAKAGDKGLITGDTLHAALSTVQIDPATLNTKANKDASNITSDDAKKWSEKLGTGSVAAGDKGLVTGGTVNTAITNAVNTATSNINNGIESKLNGKANTSLDNITDNGKTVIRNLSKEAIQLENGANTTVESRVEGNTTLYKVNVSNDAITGVIDPKITELSNTVDTKLSTKANKDASNITSDDAKKWSEKLGTGSVVAGDKGLVTGGTVNTAITNAVNTATSNINSGIETKLNGKANINASNLTNENVKEWTSKLGVGTVGQGDSSNGLVTGKSVYEAIHKYTPKGLVQTDGKVVTVDKSGTANQIDFSGTDKNGNSILREITGVITNPNEPNSVVNMDTLQSQTQGLNQKLTKAVNVGTATASALAALHPLDYDEANKVSFAVSHGQYNGSKATAFGGFVRPNENIMLSLASTINSNDRAWNAGLSFKIGSGSSHKKVSQNDFEALRNKNDKLENELNQLKEQLSKLSTRLSAKRTSFPDVPNDHWAKEAVETLHGNDVLDGYPDGEFKGDKQLTRYEYAQMLFKGLK